jgi:signal transduction histidine kinase
MASFFRAVRRGLRKNLFARYGAAAGLTLAALTLRKLIGPAIPGGPFVTFIPAIIVCAYVLGRGPALACLVASGAAAWFAFIGPAPSLQALWPSAWLTAAYAAIGLTLIVLFDRLHRVIARLERAEAEHAALLCELEDRVKARTVELSVANDQLRHEISERARAEEAIAQYARMEAMGQLVGGVSHDFNNFLHIIIGNLDMARRRGARPGPATLIHIDTALDAAKKAAVLTQRLLAFGRKQALQPAAVDVNALVEGLVDLLMHTVGEGVTLRLDLQPALPPAWVDAVQLESAVLNLAVNARDAMPGGGQLTVTTRAVPLGDDRHGIELALADNGLGMPADVAARAFEPFFTTKAPGRGTGLGLSQIHGFVRQSGGDVRLETEEGRGTRITLCLPDAAPGVAASAPTDLLEV